MSKMSEKEILDKMNKIVEKINRLGISTSVALGANNPGVGHAYEQLVEYGELWDEHNELQGQLFKLQEKKAHR